MTVVEVVWVTLACVVLYFLIGALWGIAHWRRCFREWVLRREERIKELRAGLYNSLLWDFNHAGNTTFISALLFFFWPLYPPYLVVHYVWTHAGQWVWNELLRSALPPEPEKEKVKVFGESPSYRELPEEKEQDP
jgi:hypothetical protein